MTAKRKGEGAEAGQGNGNKKGKTKENNEKVEALVDVEVASGGGCVCVAAGAKLFVLRQGEPRWCELRGGQGGDAAAVKCLAVSPCGRYVASAGNDKSLKVWAVVQGEEEGKCLWSATFPKRVSSLAFSADSGVVFAGDKFGDVRCLAVESPRTKETDKGTEIDPRRVLGHFSSIITCLSVSPCGRYLASGDRERKIRVGCVPPSPVESGVHEIQAYCIGHSAFVTALCFASSRSLISASWDGTVKLWSCEDGAEKDSVHLGAGFGVDTASPISMALLEEKSMVAVATEKRGVCLVQYSEEEGKLKPVRWIAPPSIDFVPVSIAAGARGDLWVAGCEVKPNHLGSAPSERGWYSEEELKAIQGGGGEAGSDPGSDPGSVLAAVYTLSTGPEAKYLEKQEGVWGGPGAPPVVLVENSKRVRGLQLVPSELHKHVYPLSEREYRKRHQAFRVHGDRGLN
ncbi:non-catalytic subunit of tRNA (guanine-N(7)-)-methyltransferase [Chloropicon primus]|uniref:Uncharacterized protein n=1 Tax=Chloropicon primus TaxID=1764295 RepID=A0A5B8MT40_9CHLO|nr:hypothetical protein A3770_11p64760 [Chloropicon primus]UPR03168.1 non-catalytic subunit of tRNA (guanine-N(7)-)-methyltransferase [Chloropicon primus]|eukprot:QDZ23958.1 hypothetical protein A3770_11p64760 [Chloropicon primus]